MKKKNRLLLFIVFVFVVLTIGVTFAFINIQLTGTKKQVITAGVIDLILDEDENNLQLVDALTLYNEHGLKIKRNAKEVINQTVASTVELTV